MNKKPLSISIITVSYNSETTIKDTIESVLGQSYPPLEYIVIDGASKDSTVSIVKSYQEAFEAARIHLVVVSEPDTGIYDAMNKGIRLASGDVVGILNSDDWYEPNALEIAANGFIESSEIMVVHGCLRYHYVDGRVRIVKPRTSVSRMFWIGMGYLHPSFFVRREVYEMYQFDTTYRILADYKWTMQILKEKIPFYKMNQIITNMREGGASNVYLTRIQEGQRARLELGYPAYLVWLSTFLRHAVSVVSKIRRASNL